MEALVEQQRMLLIERDGMSSADRPAAVNEQIYAVVRELANAIAPPQPDKPLGS